LAFAQITPSGQFCGLSCLYLDAQIPISMLTCLPVTHNSTWVNQQMKDGEELENERGAGKLARGQGKTLLTVVPIQSRLEDISSSVLEYLVLARIWRQDSCEFEL